MIRLIVSNVAILSSVESILKCILLWEIASFLVNSLSENELKSQVFFKNEMLLQGIISSL